MPVTIPLTTKTRFGKLSRNSSKERRLAISRREECFVGIAPEATTRIGVSMGVLEKIEMIFMITFKNITIRLEAAPGTILSKKSNGLVVLLCFHVAG